MNSNRSMMRCLALPLMTFALIPLATLSIAPANAQKPSADWTNWRGPRFNGATEAQDLPVKFSAQEGVKWSASLPGPSAATPIVYGDRVFVSAADLANQKLLAYCFDRKTGKLLWEDLAGSGYKPAGLGNTVQLDERSYYSSPSPVTDGKRVIFFYGNGDLISYSLDGKRNWTRNVQKDWGDFNFGWTFSSSPQLYDGRLYFQLLQRDTPVSGRGKDGSKSYLIALDPADARELWRVERPSPARAESREAFTTPIPFIHEGKKLMLLSGGDLLSGHDAVTGKELWRWGTWNADNRRPDYRVVPSPVAGEGLVLGCGPKREPVFAIKLGGSGDVSASHVAWKSDPRETPVTSDVPTPLFYKGKFYVASDIRKSLSCVNPSDGKILWSTPFPGTSTCWASPTAADGKIYIMSLRGDVHVVDAGTGALLATNPIATDEQELRSSVAIAHGNLFIRTNTKLFCIGK